MKRSKKLIAALVSAAMVLSLCACGAEQTATGVAETDTGATEVEQTGSEDVTTVTMAVWSSEWGDLLDNMMENFNKEHEADGVQLSIEMQSGDYSDFLGTCAATGEFPDIYVLTPYAQVQQFAQNGRLKDLSQEPFVDKVYPEALASTQYDGKVYGYPANYEYLGVFYNKALFEKAGITEVPTTPEEFTAACEKLQATGITPIASEWKESWTIKHLMSMLVSPFVADDMQGFVDGLNAGTGSFDQKWMDQVFNFCDTIKQYSGENMMDQDSTSAFTALATGNAAMCFTGEFNLAVNYAMDAPQEIGVFAVPVSEDASQNKLGVDVGIVYGVNAETEHFDACEKVLGYLSNPDDPNGYIALSSSKAGDAPPAMEYDGGFVSPASEDYQRYVDDGNTCPWVYQLYTNGFDVISGDLLQGYFAGTADKTAVIAGLNQQYADYVEANQ